MKQIFASSRDALGYLKGAYGSQTGNLQAVRKQFYSFVQYTSAGAAEFSFFGSTPGSTGMNRQLTNMPNAGDFANNHFLIKSIRTKWYIGTWDIQAWAGTDATSLVSDLLMGFFTAGVLEVTINARKYAQIPEPFLYCPPAHGQGQVFSAGLDALTLSEGTPNTLSSSRSGTPWASQNTNPRSLYLLDPFILIEAFQPFGLTISYPTGALAYLATSIVNDSTAPLYIGVELDGVVFRPVQ